MQQHFVGDHKTIVELTTYLANQGFARSRRVSKKFFLNWIINWFLRNPAARQAFEDALNDQIDRN